MDEQYLVKWKELDDAIFRTREVLRLAIKAFARAIQQQHAFEQLAIKAKKEEADFQAKEERHRFLLSRRRPSGPPWLGMPQSPPALRRPPAYQRRFSRVNRRPPISRVHSR